MAMAQAAALVEKLIGHNPGAVTGQDIANPNIDRTKYADPSGEEMQALTWQGKNTVEPRDVIIKVTGSTVCGSDLHLLHGAIIEMEKGDILGHEFCGVVESVGPEVTKLKVGQRVVASFQIACGDCMYCRQKLSSQCERTNKNSLEHGMYGGNTAGMFGYGHFTGGFAGGQSEYARVPFGDVNLLPLPDDVPDEQGLYLSDVLCTAWHCVVDTGVKEGDVVAIWGAGPIGQMCVEYSFMKGAKRVILIDGGNGAWRLAFVKAHLPRVETLDFGALAGRSVPQALKEMAHGGPDVALECVAGEAAKGVAHKLELLAGLETDTSEIVNEMIAAVRSFGRCGITGVYAAFTNHFNIGGVMERGIRFIGNGQAPVHLYWEQLLTYIREERIHPYAMLSHRVLLDDLENVYKTFEARGDRMQKVFVQTKFSAPPAKGTPPLTRFPEPVTSS